MLIFLVFTSISAIFAEKQKLSCFSTKKVHHYNYPLFSLTTNRTEFVEFDAKDKITTGPPICVTFFGYNETHSGVWQGHVSAFSLPLQCLTISGNSDPSPHCFQSPNQFNFLELPSGFACCCGGPDCNTKNPIFFQFFENNHLWKSKSVILEKLLKIIRPVCKYSFCIGFILFFVVIWSIFEAFLSIWFDKIAEKKLEKSNRNTQRIVMASPAAISLKSPEANSSLALNKTQSEPIRNVRSENSEKIEKTQEGSDEIVPIPEKPEPKVLKNGRIQKTSMNFDDSTYSDLE